MKKVTKPVQAVVFGSDLIATKWAEKASIPRENVVLATHPEEVESLSGPVTVVRVSEERWQPSTYPDEQRVRETEQALRDYKRSNQEVMEVILE